MLCPSIPKKAKVRQTLIMGSNRPRLVVSEKIWHSRVGRMGRRLRGGMHMARSAACRGRVQRNYLKPSGSGPVADEGT